MPHLIQNDPARAGNAQQFAQNEGGHFCRPSPKAILGASVVLAVGSIALAGRAAMKISDYSESGDNQDLLNGVISIGASVVSLAISGFAMSVGTDLPRQQRNQLQQDDRSIQESVQEAFAVIVDDESDMSTISSTTSDTQDVGTDYQIEMIVLSEQGMTRLNVDAEPIDAINSSNPSIPVAEVEPIYSSASSRTSSATSRIVSEISC